jgi:hypothetical protein
MRRRLSTPSPSYCLPRLATDPIQASTLRAAAVSGADQIVVEADQILSGIGLISNAGARFEAARRSPPRGASKTYDPEQHLKDMALDGVAGEVLYPSQGLFYFKWCSLLMSAIFRAYNDWLAEFCCTDPARLKGIAMINLDDVSIQGRSRCPQASLHLA